MFFVPQMIKNQIELVEMSAGETFSFTQERGHVISLVGAGGKTTLLHYLAGICSQNGIRTVVMTSTHMFCPSKRPLCEDIESVRKEWKQNRYAIAGSLERSTNQGRQKIIAPDASLLESIWNEAECVLIEADGAKEYAFKLPAAHEPVIWEKTDIVIGIAGLSALDQTFTQGCFRSELGDVWLYTGSPDRADITTVSMTRVLMSERGTRKGIGNRQYYIVLNQCDTEADRKNAEEIIKNLWDQNHKKIAVSCFSTEERRSLKV